MAAMVRRQSGEDNVVAIKNAFRSLSSRDRVRRQRGTGGRLGDVRSTSASGD
jgi:hypothetical protein